MRETATGGLHETTALLERTPRVVRAPLEGLPDSWLDTPDTPDGWTPRDVIGHLISAELDDWIPRVEITVHDLDHVAQISPRDPPPEGGSATGCKHPHADESRG